MSNNSDFIVLGIDPGFSVTGYGIIKKSGGRIQVLDCGLLKMASSKHLSERIGIFHAFFTEKIKQYNVVALSLETPFLGKNAQTFLKLGYLRGILYLLADTYKLAIFEYSPSQVKLSLTGSGSADKEQVANVVMRLFPGLRLPDKLDLTDALAVSLCSVFSIRTPYFAKAS